MSSDSEDEYGTPPSSPRNSNTAKYKTPLSSSRNSKRIPPWKKNGFRSENEAIKYHKYPNMRAVLAALGFQTVEEMDYRTKEIKRSFQLKFGGSTKKQKLKKKLNKNTKTHKHKKTRSKK